MNIKVKFFASLKDELECSEVLVSLIKGATVETLCHTLSDKNSRFKMLFGMPDSKVKCAINYEMADFSEILNDNDEVAFFPPVTGG